MPRKLQSAGTRVNRFSRRICARGGVATNIEAVATEIERDYLMEATGTARRTEDIALDLLKFVASHAHVGSKAASATTGFGPPSAAKTEDQVADLLELYARCRQAVEAPVTK